MATPARRGALAKWIPLGVFLLALAVRLIYLAQDASSPWFHYRFVDANGDDRLDAASRRAMAVGARSYKHVARILKHRLDAEPLPDEVPTDDTRPSHEHVRGSGYYHTQSRYLIQGIVVDANKTQLRISKQVRNIDGGESRSSRDLEMEWKLVQQIEPARAQEIEAAAERVANGS